MSRWCERLRRAPGRDAGFSLIEVVVALGILMLVVVTLLPQLVVGIRATGTARQVSQAKGIAQGELERVRNLPFHISPEAGNYRDVLDFYYTNLTPPATPPTCTGSGGYTAPQVSWSGYVSATAARCDYEPASGAFYRVVKQVPAANGIGDFTLVVDTRFLTGTTPPQTVTPPSGYNTQSTVGSRPASHQVGVTVTTLYADRATLKPASTTTQISNQLPATTRVRGEANATALEVGSVTTANGPVSLSSGLLNFAGSLTYASTVTANLSGVSAGLATGETSTGTSRAVAAPPTTAAGVALPGAGSLGTTGCVLACWGSSRLDLASLSASNGLPLAGSPAAPLQSLITDTVHDGISFGNSAATAYRPELRLVPPLLKLDPDGAPAPSGVASGCALGASGVSSYSTATGYLRTTPVDDAAEPSTVDVCVLARTSSISLFPTEFAPRGVLLVELRRASARCRVQTPAHTASTTLDYEAVVKYYDGTDYRVAGTVTSASTSDPLDGIDLATTSVGGTKFLGDYISSWSALTRAEATATAAGGEATVRLPGVVTISTQPVRADTAAPDGLDPTSVVSLTVGALTCSAVDAR